MSIQQKGRFSDVAVGIITALPLEAKAAQRIFDETYESGTGDKDATERHQLPIDWNSYTLGKIGKYKAVLAHMPGMGKVKAASMASTFQHNFPQAKLVLLLGICGAVPEYSNESKIYLGDIIIGESIIQHDFGKRYADTLDRNNLHDTSSREIGSFLAKLKSRNQELHAKTIEYCNDFVSLPDFAHPGADKDFLFDASYMHRHHTQTSDLPCGCEKERPCSVAKTLSCTELGCATESSRIRSTQNPFIHYGPIASGDAVIKSGEHRDEIAKSIGAIAFDMESAGMWNLPSYLVIKSASDYADSHKNNVWQSFAAATSASCAKAVLGFWEDPKTMDESDDRRPAYMQKNVSNNAELVKIGVLAEQANLNGPNTFNL